MIKMKNRIIYILTILIVFSWGCGEDFFELTDPGNYTVDSYYQVEDHADKAVTACYSTLNKQGVYFRELVHWPDQLSDEFFATGFAAGAGNWGGITNHDVVAGGGELNDLWRRLYEGVYACNVAIQRIPQIKERNIEFTQEKEDFYIGQAYFLRAFYYHLLTSYFGENIPMITKIAESSEDFYPSGAEEGAIFSLMVDDLNEAQSRLPKVDDFRGTSKLGRATKGAAIALLGKIYLYKKDWPKASAKFEKLINQQDQYGTYELVDYRSMFTDQNANSNESIWEIQFANLGGGVWAAGGDNPNQDERQAYTISRSHNRYTNNQYWWNFAIRQDRVEGGRSKPEEESGTRDELWTFEKDGEGNYIDNRVYATFWGVRNGATYNSKHNNAKLGHNDLKWNEQNFSPHPVEGYCYGLRKCDVDEFIEKSDKYKDINYIVIRYADVLLMYAEAQLMQGNENIAKEYIQMIRDRANEPMSDQEGLPNTIPGNLPSVDELMAQKGWTLKEVLQHERYVELFGEGVRWFDIQRWEIGDQVLSYKQKWDVIKSNNYLLPVPQSEIDNNPNYSGNIAN